MAGPRGWLGPWGLFYVWVRPSESGRGELTTVPLHVSRPRGRNGPGAPRLRPFGPSAALPRAGGVESGTAPANYVGAYDR